MAFRKSIRILLLLAVSLVILLIALRNSKKASDMQSMDDIAASLDASFVEGDLILELSDKGGYPIYYTLDGSVPTLNSLLYEGPIIGKAQKEVQSIVIRACAWEENTGTWGDVFTRTFFYAEDMSAIKNRFSTYIVCLTSDPYNLYDYEYGILTEGKIRDEYMASDAYEPDLLTQPANFTQTGREWEREAYIEILSADGERLIAQNGGIRVFGYASRQSASKSFKLYAREEYGKRSFAYPFFPENMTGDGQALQDSYERLVVRNHGTDRRGALLREEMFQRLCGEIERMDSKCVAPVSLWLNGAYYNFQWLQEVYDDLYMIENYGLTQPSDYYGKITIRANQIDLQEELSPEDAKAAKDYERIMAFSKKDFTDDRVYEEFLELVDIENMLRYFAIETYIANWDWPGNNVKAYRYYSSGGNYEVGRRDGRWRYLLYDMEAGFNIFNESMEDWIGIADVLDASSLFQALMKRQDVQEQFVSELQLCMDEFFTEKRVHEVIDGLKKERNGELAASLAYKQGQNPEYTFNMDMIEDNIEVIYDFVEKRPAQIRQEVKELFHIDMQ